MTDGTDSVGERTRPGPRLAWWREVIASIVFYELYSLARNTQGSGSTSPTHAFRNARVVINFERALGLYHEESIQRVFLDIRPLMQVFNVYYGSAHFLVTGAVLAWLFVYHPDRYSRWRWALAGTTLLGLIGFVAFPVMPPRLISPNFGMGAYVDTLRTIGGLWNFEDGAIAKLSNQYAAMPSLHFAWSLWCCLAMWPYLRQPWSRAVVVAHPVLTLVAIIATANHYWLDAVGGSLALLGGWLLGGVLVAGLVGRVDFRSRVAPQVPPVDASPPPAPPQDGSDRAVAGTVVVAEQRPGPSDSPSGVR